jgi:hypothetical protein
MYLNSCFLGKISGKNESLIAKIHFVDSVRVWLYLTGSKLDFNVLVMSTLHFGVLCPIALIIFFEIYRCSVFNKRVILLSFSVFIF